MTGNIGTNLRRFNRPSHARLAGPVLVAVMLVAIGACSSTTDDSSRASTKRPIASTTIPKGSTASSGTATDWPSYGHDLANTRQNPKDKTINAATVSTLKKSWAKPGLVGVSGTPVVSRGVAYFGDWKGTAWAVNADTGKELWHTSVPGGFIVGAPAVEGEAVYIANGHTLYRLSRATGAIEWKATTNESSLAQINASPVVVGGLVLQGTAGIQDAVPDPTNSFRGSIGAYDAKTGKETWRFYATPGNATAGSGVGICVDSGRRHQTRPALHRYRQHQL